MGPLISEARLSRHTHHTNHSITFSSFLDEWHTDTLHARRQVRKHESAHAGFLRPQVAARVRSPLQGSDSAWGPDCAWVWGHLEVPTPPESGGHSLIPFAPGSGEHLEVTIAPESGGLLEIPTPPGSGSGGHSEVPTAPESGGRMEISAAPGPKD
jgi:hypothetical protein